MDYILFPGPAKRTFAGGDIFSAHIRHVLLKSPELPSVERLEELWSDFAKSHAATRNRAARAELSDSRQTPTSDEGP
jgi:hypothetical protein